MSDQAEFQNVYAQSIEGKEIENIHEAEINNKRKRAARECFKSGA